MDHELAEAAGIANAASRSDLLDYLESVGFSLDEMVEAELQGRLFALAGDAQVRSGPPIYTLRDVSNTLAIPVTEVAAAWYALGLTAGDVDARLLSEADLEGLRTWAMLRAGIGEELTSGLLRVLGTSMARLAEAESAAIRGGAPDIQLDVTADEARTAKAFGDIASLVPRIGLFMDAVHRQHLQSTRSYFESVIGDATANVTVGVGFADLSGFTALTRRLTLTELSVVLTAFGGVATDVVHEHDGRLVKLLGDAVMWVNADPNKLAEVANHLVRHPVAESAGIQVRAGLAYGDSLALFGDYFGTAVNLAARLVAVAEPGQILASADLVERLDGWLSEPLPPVALHGFDEPVTPHALRPT
jgi:class 3 adenylate cyclase